MDYRGDRPPCQTHPRQFSQSSAPPLYPQNNLLPNDGSRGNVSFRNTEQGPPESPRARTTNFQSAYQPAGAVDSEAAAATGFCARRA
ncbi:hypothetical protein C8R43DRAFT_440808 [Mycena crocata]|nr:hypothetical protein C8R43DRAFT_440808 [Mycena crocata]